MAALNTAQWAAVSRVVLDFMIVLAYYYFSLSPFNYRFGSQVSWRVLEEVFPHYPLEALHCTMYIVVHPLPGVEDTVNGLSPLLSVESKSKLPLSTPWNYVVFHHVEFWGDTGFGKFSPVKLHERFNVGL